jgi:MarR family transcriptional regulator for hemolysin
MPDVQAEFIPSLFNLRNGIRFAIDAAFRPLGITDATWRTLYYLEQTGSGVNQKQLAEVMGIEGPSLVRLLDNLESKKLIERRPSETDRRAKSIHLTPEGKELLVDLHQISDSVRVELLSEVSEQDLQTCISVFGHISSKLDRVGAA